MSLFKSRLTDGRRKKFWIPPVATLPEPSAARKAAETPMTPARAYRLPESVATQTAESKQPQVVAAE